jgi:hypothetical protein
MVSTMWPFESKNVSCTSGNRTAVFEEIGNEEISISIAIVPPEGPTGGLTALTGGALEPNLLSSLAS